MSGKPNIVLIVADHQAYYRHGWDEGPRPLTPNYDRLAAEGVRFERSYCATPLCGPSRRTLITGLYPHNHKNYYNYSNSPYDHDVYYDILADAGYRNVVLGKWHAGPGTALDFKTEGMSYTDYGNPYTSPEYHEYLARNGLPPAEHYIEMMFHNDALTSQFPNLKANARYRCDGYWCGEHAAGITLTPKETHESFFLANLACDKLEELAQTEDGEPFHLRVDFWGPHQPHFPTQEFVDLYTPEDIPEYGSFRDTLEKKPSFFMHDPNQPIGNKEGEFQIPSPLSWEEWQHIIARAYAHNTMIDAAGGLILDKLDALGLTENTVVIWTSDHGDALASHGGRFDKGSYMTEEVVRVPLAIRYPALIKPDQQVSQLVSGVDIPVTILEAAGTAFTDRVDGCSLLPLCTGADVPWREDLLVETYGHGFGTREIGRMLVWENFKYVVYQNHISELYDLNADPFELHNLIDNPQHAQTVTTMQTRLARSMKESNDSDLQRPISEAFIAADLADLDQLFRRRGMIE